MAQPQTNNTTERVMSPAVNVNAQPVAPDATTTTLPGTSSDPPNPSVSQFLASQLPTLDPQPGQNLPQSYTTEPNLAMNDGFSSSCYGSYPDLSGVYGCHGLPVQAQCGPGFNIINQTASELTLELCSPRNLTALLPLVAQHIIRLGIQQPGPPQPFHAGANTYPAGYAPPDTSDHGTV